MSIDALAADLRGILIEQMAAIHAADVAVLLSGGADSAAVCAAGVAAGKRMRAYGFTLDGWVSKDFSDARLIARTLSVPFTTILLPTNLAELVAAIRMLGRTYGLTKKADVECGWPRLIARQYVQESVVVTGDGADGYYGMGRKAAIACPDNPAAFDAQRTAYFERPDPAQMYAVKRMFANVGRLAVYPWMEPRIMPLFRPHDWRACNKPRQKEPTRRAFPEVFDRVRVPPHRILQGKDSRIRELFAQLLDTPYNVKGRKAPAALYRDLIMDE